MSTKEEKKPGLSAGAIVGIVFAIVFLIVLIIFMFQFYSKRKFCTGLKSKIDSGQVSVGEPAYSIYQTHCYYGL